MEAEYIAACEAAKEAVWLRKFFTDLEVVPDMDKPLVLYCDNSGAVANSKEPRSHKRGKHIERKYHLIREIVHRGCWLRKNILRSRSNRKNKISGSVGTVTFLNFSKHF